MSPSKRPRFLIIRLGSMGDVVHTLPALTALRHHFPAGHITWVVEEEFADIVRGHPYLDRVISLSRKKWTREFKAKRGTERWNHFAEGFKRAWSLREERFDVSFDFHGNLRSGILSRLFRVKWRLGFDWKCSKEFNHLFSQHRVHLDFDQHKIDRNTGLVLQGLGLDGPHQYQPVVFVPQEARRAVAELVSDYPSERPLVILHPGVSYHGRVKNWPRANVAALADKLIDELGAVVLLSWGPGEESLRDDVLAQAKREIHIPPRPLTLEELKALFERTDLFIGCDTGPLHLAAAMGRPVIGVYGPKSPTIYGPYYRGQVVRADEMPCIGCNLNACPLDSNMSPCMVAVSPDRVFQVARRELEKTLQKGGAICVRPNTVA